MIIYCVLFRRLRCYIHVSFPSNQHHVRRVGDGANELGRRAEDRSQRLPHGPARPGARQEVPRPRHDA